MSRSGRWLLASFASLVAAVGVAGAATPAAGSVSSLLDASFGVGGGLVVATSPSSSRGDPTREFVRPDGRVVLVSAPLFLPSSPCVGGSVTEGGSRTTVVVLTATGAVEPGFAAGAPLVVCGEVREVVTAADNSLRMAVRSIAGDGSRAAWRSVVVAQNGSVASTSAAWSHDPASVFVEAGFPTRDGGLLLHTFGGLAKIAADGRVDSSFGARGSVPFPSGVSSVAELVDGSFLVFPSGASTGAGVRWLSAAGADRSPPEWEADVERSGTVSLTSRVKQVAADRFLAIGSGAIGSTALMSFVLFSDTGRSVAGFGANGRMTITSVEPLLDATAAPDNSLSVLTQSGDSTRLTRRRADGTVDPTIGGDGSVLRSSNDSPPNPLDLGSWFRVDALVDNRLVIGLRTAGFQTQLQVVRAGASPIGAGGVRKVQVAGLGGVPSDATTVILNVTVDGADAAGYLSVQSCSASVPPVSSTLNFAARRPAAAATLARLDPDGTICVFSSARADVLFDVLGWQRPGDNALVTQTPNRVTDTRQPTSSPTGRIPAATNTRIPVAGAAGVPTAATTVTLNVTVDRTAATGFVSIRSCNETGFPQSSTVNFTAAQTVANFTVAQLDTAGGLCAWSSTPIHLIVDAVGWERPQTAGLVSQSPRRIIDTRTNQPVTAGVTRRVQLLDQGGVPSNATTVFVNVTADRATADGYLSVRSCTATGIPQTSTLNFSAGRTVANASIVHPDPDGAICITASATTDVIIDVTGWEQPGANVLATQEPQRILDTRNATPTVR